jgi:UDP-N-acetylglucosamine 3-dehydrogenase
MAINFAVIGVGNIGQHHARVASQSFRYNLVGVVDPDRMRAQVVADQLGTNAFVSIDELMAHQELDAVSICVPTSLHKDIALDCIAKGLHVLVEKPIASTVEDGEAILAAAKAKGVSMHVGHIERFNPAVLEVKRIIDSGELGAVNSIVARRVGIMPPQIQDVDIAVDLAIHDIDIICYLFGEQPQSVLGNKQKTILQDRADCVEIFFKFSQGSGFIQSNWITPVKIRRLNVTGTRGYITMDFIEQTVDIYVGNEALFEVDRIMPYAIAPEPKHTSIKLPKLEPLALELDYFAELIETKNPGDSQFAIDALKLALQL